MTKWIRSNWFLLALASVFLFGHLFADLLVPLNKSVSLRSLVVMLVMWAMGITISPDAIRKSVARPSASLLAIGVNIVLVPLLCLPPMWFLPTELAGGLFVAGLVPCTLASASVWTRRAGGNDSVAMMTTVVTNVACVAVVPLGVQMVLALQTRVAPLAQMEKLIWFVVLPLIVAQVMRRAGADRWAERNKQRITMGAQVGILAMVLFGAVAGGGTDSGDDGSGPWGVVAVASATVAVHLAALVLAIWMSRQAAHSRSDQIAVGIAGSQKTLTVGLQIAIDCGVSVVPMLIYHAGQLVLDTMIADRWKRRSAERDRSGSAGEQ